MFEEGTRLRRFCEQKLADTEQRIEAIIKEKAASKPEKLPTEEFDEHDIKGMKKEDIPF
jgi:exonuclease VII small subunit